MEKNKFMEFNVMTGRYEYISSSAAPVLEPEKKENLKPVKKNAKQVKREAASSKRRHISSTFAGVVTTLFCVCALSFLLVQYIDKQAELHTESTRVAALENEYNSLRIFNDEAEIRVSAGIDNEQIKEMAINSLGMKLADKDQVYTYTVSTVDYMRRVNAE